MVITYVFQAERGERQDMIAKTNHRVDAQWQWMSGIRTGDKKTFRRRSSSSRCFLLSGVFAVVFGVAFVGVYYHMQPALASWLIVKNIVVSGLGAIEREERVHGLDLGPEASLLSLNITEVEDRLENHPWVASVVVGRALPDTLTVVIVERRPAARVAGNFDELILDEEGFVLPNREHAVIGLLPALQGLDPQRLVHGDPVVRQHAQQGIKIAKVLSSRFGGVPRVHLRDSSRIIVDVRNLRFRFGHMFEEQWERFLLLDASLEQRFETASREIDLRFPGKVIVRERG